MDALNELCTHNAPDCNHNQINYIKQIGSRVDHYRPPLNNFDKRLTDLSNSRNKTRSRSVPPNDLAVTRSEVRQLKSMSPVPKLSDTSGNQAKDQMTISAITTTADDIPTDRESIDVELFTKLPENSLSSTQYINAPTPVNDQSEATINTEEMEECEVPLIISGNVSPNLNITDERVKPEEDHEGFFMANGLPFGIENLFDAHTASPRLPSQNSGCVQSATPLIPTSELNTPRTVDSPRVSRHKSKSAEETKIMASNPLLFDDPNTSLREMLDLGDGGKSLVSSNSEILDHMVPRELRDNPDIHYAQVAEDTISVIRRFVVPDIPCRFMANFSLSRSPHKNQPCYTRI